MKSKKDYKRFSEAMRRTPTPSERTILNRLRAEGLTCQSQIILGPFIVDLVLPGLMVVVEVDGGSHHTTRGKLSDARRDEYLQGLGFTVIRIENDEVEDYPLEKILQLPEIPGSVFAEALRLARGFRRTRRVDRGKQS